MLSLTETRKILASTAVSDEYFLRLHFCVESIMQRFLLIGLRLQGVQYKLAESITETYHQPFKGYIKTAFKYCEIDYGKLKAFGKYALFEDLVLNFTSRHRNRRVHGIASLYTDEEMLKLLISIDKGFIGEIEAFLSETGSASLFDPPKKWSAKRGTKKDPKTVYHDLFGKEPPEPPAYTKEKVKKLLEGISF